MADEPSVQQQVASLDQGGIWTGENILTDATWSGEDATKSESSRNKDSKGKAPVIAPKTPSQEDQALIQQIIGDPSLVSALCREMERKMLREAGRSVHTSLILQLTQDREEADRRIRDWITTNQATQAVRASDESKSAESKIRSLEEKLISLENKMQELQMTTVVQQQEEKSIVDEALKIIAERKRADAESDNTPSEVNRMTERSRALEEHIEHIRTQLPIVNQTATRSPATRNSKKFGRLF